ncbi:LysM peptidoglycan-binding domain-containing protein [Amycolatopsis pigmentata]|uniref:LysM peptidoglycan-binding domain-containing protein n=1 Tax=Amycolatopsis pigmentata TaxID=450801 RepID=A0ABW5FUP2_9PSEU
MSVLVDEDQVTGQIGSRARMPVRARRRAGEPRRPPGRARLVAGRRPLPRPGCAPRRVAPRWPWLAALAVTMALIITGLGVFSAAMTPSVPDRTATVFVARGQSLGELAREYAPDSDPAAVVARIRQLNRLDGDVLVPGMPLTVPVSSGAPASRP